MCYLGTQKFLNFDYLYSDPLTFVYKGNFLKHPDRNIKLAHI